MQIDHYHAGSQPHAPQARLGRQPHGSSMAATPVFSGMKRCSTLMAAAASCCATSSWWSRSDWRSACSLPPSAKPCMRSTSPAPRTRLASEAEVSSTKLSALAGTVTMMASPPNWRDPWEATEPTLEHMLLRPPLSIEARDAGARPTGVSSARGICRSAASVRGCSSAAATASVADAGGFAGAGAGASAEAGATVDAVPGAAEGAGAKATRDRTGVSRSMRRGVVPSCRAGCAHRQTSSRSSPLARSIHRRSSSTGECASHALCSERSTAARGCAHTRRARQAKM
eukprot:scaffold140056_cov60-Phaeocystis_antarctica.AAC.6